MDKIKEKEVDQTIELDETAASLIAEKVTKGLEPMVADTVSKKLAEQKEAAEKELEDKELAKKKGVEGVDGIQVKASPFAEKIAFVRAALDLMQNNFTAVRRYNKSVIESREKAGYANEGTGADGGYVVPPADFEAAVEKLLPVYGVAFADADVREVRGNSVLTNKLGSNVTMYDTAEAGAKTGTKLTITQDNVTLRKFAAIAPVTDELGDDAAIDFYNELVEGFAQERARWADKIVFTENGTVYKGLLRTPGINVETIGSSISSVTWDDLLNAESKVPTNAFKNGKWYMHRTVWNLIKQSKDSEGRYQMFPAAGLQTPWGTPVVLADIMPASTEADSDSATPFAVFGDLKRVKLYVKKGLVIEILKEGTVHDAGNNAINLGEQDMKAVRAVTRMVKLVKFPEAFSAIGTGTVS